MEDRDKVFADLATRFVNYQKLSPIPVEDNGEPMCDVEKYGLKIDHDYSGLPLSTGKKLILRKGVCECLVKARTLLKEKNPNYDFVLVYAYRSLEIQRNSFEKMKRELGFGDRTDPEAYERTHHFIAVPEVAGHPTGAAIDLLICDKNRKSLDFGTGMHALERNSYAFSPFISNEAKENRALLRSVMMDAGFAPYDGEWWHYSYGDREWAAYYNEPKAFYTQLEYNPAWEKEERVA